MSAIGQSAASNRRVAADVMHDDDQLARRARTTLAGADVGLLLTGDGQGRMNLSVPVRIFDDGGEALIQCGSTSAIARAARLHRLASLTLAPNPTFGVRLTLSGRLSGTDGRRQRPSSVHPTVLDRAKSSTPDSDILVALRVDEVSAGCPHGHPGTPIAGEHRLPIAVYALAKPDEVAANTPRIISHLNVERAAQVRLLAAHATGVPLRRIAAATVTALTTKRAEFSWIDETGVHPAILPFECDARTLVDLAGTLRRCVATALETIQSHDA
jgi:hypothetical protein